MEFASPSLLSSCGRIARKSLCFVTVLLVPLACGSPAQESPEETHVGTSQSELGRLRPRAHGTPLGPSTRDGSVRTRYWRVHLGPDRFAVVKRMAPHHPLTRRAPVLLLPGTIVDAEFVDIPVEGYSTQTTLAQRGFDTYSLEYEGTKRSSFPENGLDVTHDYLVESVRLALDWVYRKSGFRRVHVYGEANGGAIAAELCADARKTRSCILSSMIYREGTAFFESVFLDPGFLAFLGGQPNGYLETTPELYFNIAARTTPEVGEWILNHQPGKYAAAMTLEAVQLPWFNPTHAAVPGLVIQGTEENIATQADADDLVNSYGSAADGGGVAQLVRIEGAGHLPRIEPPPLNIEYLEAVLEFLESH